MNKVSKCPYCDKTYIPSMHSYARNTNIIEIEETSCKHCSRHFYIATVVQDSKVVDIRPLTVLQYSNIYRHIVYR